MLWPILRIDVGNISAVSVQGILNSPIMLVQTKPRRQITGTILISLAPSSIHIVTAPEMNIKAAMKNDDTIIRNRLLNFRNNQALRSDMQKRTTPRNIDDIKGSISSAPASLKEIKKRNLHVMKCYILNHVITFALPYKKALR